MANRSLRCSYRTLNLFPLTPSPPTLSFPPPPPPPQTHLQSDLNHFPYIDSQEALNLSNKNMPFINLLQTLAPRALPTEQTDVDPPINPSFIRQPLDKVIDPLAEIHAPRRAYRKRGPKPVQEPKQIIKSKDPIRWTKQEDKVLRGLVRDLGEHWAQIAKLMNDRKGKQCRERWNNHLRPSIKKYAAWTREEEAIIVEVHKNEGSRWANLGKILEGRTENSIKNHWNSTKRKVVSNNIYSESSPLQRYIGQAIGALPRKAINVRDLASSSTDPSSPSDNSGAGPSFRADHGSTSNASAEEGAQGESIVLRNFFV